MRIWDFTIVIVLLHFKYFVFYTSAVQDNFHCPPWVRKAVQHMRYRSSFTISQQWQSLTLLHLLNDSYFTIYCPGLSLREALQEFKNKIINSWTKVKCVRLKRRHSSSDYLPVDTVSFSCGRRTILKHMSKMCITNSTKNLLARHENNWQIQLCFHIVAQRLVIGWPPSSTIELSRWSVKDKVNYMIESNVRKWH